MTQDELNDLMDRLGDVLREGFEAGLPTLSAEEQHAAVQGIGSGAATMLYEVRSRVSCHRSVRCRIANDGRNHAV